MFSAARSHEGVVCVEPFRLELISHQITLAQSQYRAPGSGENQVIWPGVPIMVARRRQVDLAIAMHTLVGDAG